MLCIFFNSEAKIKRNAPGRPGEPFMKALEGPVCIQTEVFYGCCSVSSVSAPSVTFLGYCWVCLVLISYNNYIQAPLVKGRFDFSKVLQGKGWDLPNQVIQQWQDF